MWTDVHTTSGEHREYVHARDRTQQGGSRDVNSPTLVASRVRDRVNIEPQFSKDRTA